VSWIVVFVAGLTPAALLLLRALTNNLTANPIEFVTHWTGDWTRRFLLICLAITPLRRLTGLHSLIQFRRTLGLLAFFYGTLHLLTYVVLDYFFAFDLMLDNIGENLFIIAGVVAFVLMIPLALTSNRAMVRRLGGRRWRMLHRLVYVSALAGVVHYSAMSKIDIRTPLMYGAILAVLLAFRVWHRFRPELRRLQSEP
jgi:sulfoxide reductase heme-binding subunit YedZ